MRLTRRPMPLTQQGFDHVLVALAFAVIIALGGTYFLVATHAAAPVSQWQGVLQEGSASSGYCLTSTNGANKSKVVLSACAAGNSNQTWSLHKVKTATVVGVTGVQEFYLQNSAGTLECLNNPYGSKTNGTAIQMYTCNPNDNNALWMWGAKFTGKGLSAHQLLSVAAVSGSSAKCLDDAYGSHTANTKVQTWTCKTSGQANQNWFEASALTGGGGSGSSGVVSYPQSPTSTCAPTWQMVTLSGAQWVRTSNNWGGANVCLNQWNGMSVSYLVQSQSAKPTGGVMAYPDISQGCSRGGGSCTSGWTSRQISALGNPSVSWVTSHANAATGSKYDTAADLWFSSTSNFQSYGAEILISINNQGAPPNTSKQVSIGGVNYYFYVVPQHGWDEIIFARVQQVSSVNNMALKPFMTYAVSQSLMPSSYYFVNASFGNEIWQGGTGLETTGLSLSQ